MSIATRKGYIENAENGGFLVGAKDTDGRYNGPVARVSADANWLYIVTDDFEGSAMLNIESLPYLRRALAIIARKMGTNREGV